MGDDDIIKEQKFLWYIPKREKSTSKPDNKLSLPSSARTWANWDVLSLSLFIFFLHYSTAQEPSMKANRVSRLIIPSRLYTSYCLNRIQIRLTLFYCMFSVFMRIVRNYVTAVFHFSEKSLWSLRKSLHGFILSSFLNLTMKYCGSIGKTYLICEQLHKQTRPKVDTTQRDCLLVSTKQD